MQAIIDQKALYTALFENYVEPWNIDILLFYLYLTFFFYSAATHQRHWCLREGRGPCQRSFKSSTEGRFTSSLLRLFLEEPVLANIVEQTNRYARQERAKEGSSKESWWPVTIEEIMASIGAAVTMGISYKGDMREYWSILFIEVHTNTLMPLPFLRWATDSAALLLSALEIPQAILKHLGDHVSIRMELETLSQHQRHDQSGNLVTTSASRSNWKPCHHVSIMIELEPSLPCQHHDRTRTLITMSTSWSNWNIHFSLNCSWTATTPFTG